MLQGGDPLGTGTGGPGYTFDDEISEKNFNEPYVLAMANAGTRRNALTGRPSGTNGSQFFITVGPSPHLQGKHTVFGQVADEDSKKVVDAIEGVKTDMRDRPSRTSSSPRSPSRSDPARVGSALSGPPDALSSPPPVSGGGLPAVRHGAR